MNSLTNQGLSPHSRLASCPTANVSTLEKRTAKHVTLGSLKGKSCATLKETRPHEILAFSRACPGEGQNHLGKFPGRCRKVRDAIVSFKSRERVLSRLRCGTTAADSTIMRLSGEATLATRHREGSALIPATPDDVFAFVDDHH